MTLEDFEKLQAIADEEVKMPDKLREIIEKNNILPAIIQKWTKLFTKQTFIVQSLKTDLEEQYGTLFKYYKFNDKYSWGSTKEIDTQINCNVDYCKKVRELNEQKYFLDYITETLSTIKNLNFVIKNYLEYEKMKMG